jgi:hypothetical protein
MSKPSTIFIALLLVFAGMAFAVPTRSIANLPLVRSLEGQSLNWSGYAVSVPDVTSVTGTFNVPTVGAPGNVGGLPTDVSVWVGIDGYTSGTVEQVGVSGSYDDATSTASYYAWWELYPRFSMPIRAMPVNAGDTMTAIVTYLGGGSFQLSIEDTTSSHSFSIVAHAPVNGPKAAVRDSAEWVVERAATISKGYLTILPLATFSDVTITDASFTVGTQSPVTHTLQYAVGTYAEYLGYPTDPCTPSCTPPGQPYWENMYIVGYNGAYYVLDSTGPVATNSFTVHFLHNGEPFPIPGVFR